MKIFNSIEHVFAWVISKIVAGAPVVAKDAQAVVTAAESPLGKFIAGLDPAVGTQVLNDLQAVGGCVVRSAQAVGAAAAADGLNVAFDAAGLTALEGLVSAVGGLFHAAATTAPSSGTSAPAA